MDREDVLIPFPNRRRGTGCGPPAACRDADAREGHLAQDTTLTPRNAILGDISEPKVCCLLSMPSMLENISNMLPLRRNPFTGFLFPFSTRNAALASSPMSPVVTFAVCEPCA